MTKMLYLVTGAFGHLGSQIVKLLLQKGGAVRALLLPGEDDSLLRGLPVEAVLGDVRDKESLKTFFTVPAGVQTRVIHAAGIVSIAAKANENLRRVNVEGTRNIVELCLESGVDRLLYVSSVHALPEMPKGTPITEVKFFDSRLVAGAYAKTKAEATQIVMDAAKRGLDAVVAHPSGIIGPGDNGRNPSNQVFRDYLYGRLPVIVKGGYDFVDVRDVAMGCLLALDKGKAGECYILSNAHFDVRHLTGILQKAAGLKRRPVALPLGLVAAFAPLAEALDTLRSKTPVFTKYSLYTLNTNDWFVSDKARRELGYTVRPIEETMRDIMLWERERQGPPAGKRERWAKTAPAKGK